MVLTKPDPGSRMEGVSTSPRLGSLALVTVDTSNRSPYLSSTRCLSVPACRAPCISLMLLAVHTASLLLEGCWGTERLSGVLRSRRQRDIQLAFGPRQPAPASMLLGAGPPRVQSSGVRGRWPRSRR